MRCFRLPEVYTGAGRCRQAAAEPASMCSQPTASEWQRENFRARRCRRWRRQVLARSIYADAREGRGAGAVSIAAMLQRAQRSVRRSPAKGHS